MIMPNIIIMLYKEFNNFNQIHTLCMFQSTVQKILQILLQ